MNSRSGNRGDNITKKTSTATKEWSIDKDEELKRKLNQLSAEDFRKLLREATNFIVRSLSERSKTPEELMQWRDKMLAPSPFPQHPILAEDTTEMKKQFHEKILEKKGRATAEENKAKS